MSKNNSKSWLTDTLIPFLKSMVVIAIFSPWLLVIYPLVTTYSATLDINDREVIKGFVEWFGTAYSFFLALAIVNVWSQFETVERELDRELDALSTLLQTVGYTRATNKKNKPKLQKFKKSIHDDIQKYIIHVIKNHPSEHVISQHHNNGDQILVDMGNRIGDLATQKIIIEPFIYELFGSLNEAMDVRGDRISHSKPYAPVIVQVVAITASVIWLFSFFGLVIYDLWVTIALIGGVAFIIIMVLIIFFDLSEPFGGIWRIKLDEWQEFLYLIDLDPTPDVFFIFSNKGNIIGKIRYLIGLDSCKLNSFAHSGFWGVAWKEFIKKTQTNRENVSKIIKCQALYSDQLSYHGYDVFVNGQDSPLVILKQGKKISILLSKQEINNCQNLSEFEIIFNSKMRRNIKWF